ncbi:MAG TPA: DUF2752 domain-containing protein [Vicinamibacterales bacterium]|nr:DUF2752 domain-containing protein [Vicinamibacterales bacterium]
MTAPPVRLTAAVRRARAREAAFVSGMLAFAALTNPDRPLPFDVCLWHRLTGYRCLTCGLTRALCHAVQGDWTGSFAYHPAGIVALILLVGWAVRSSLEASTGKAISLA